MPDYSLTAVRCPALKVRTTALDPAAALAGNASPVAYRGLLVGDILELAPSVNELAVAAEALGAFGGGAYAIVSGIGGELLLSAGSGLTLNVADGAALIDVVITPLLPSVVLSNDTYNYVWLTRARAFTVLTSADPDTPPTPPSTACTYLGRALTAAGAITEVDHSGRAELRGGTLVRRTGDAAAPTDNPPDSLQFLAITAGGRYWWDGLAYTPLGAAPTELLFSFGATWTAQPAALTELLGVTTARRKFDLRRYTQARVVAYVDTAGAAGAKLRAQYSTDESAWAYLDGATGPSVAVDATGVEVSAWVDLEAAARADVFLRLVGIDGDGAADPVFGTLALQFR